MDTQVKDLVDEPEELTESEVLHTLKKIDFALLFMAHLAMMADVHGWEAVDYRLRMISERGAAYTCEMEEEIDMLLEMVERYVSEWMVRGTSEEESERRTRVKKWAANEFLRAWKEVEVSTFTPWECRECMRPHPDCTCFNHLKMDLN